MSPPLKTIVRRPLNRRDLLKALPLGVVGAGTAGLVLYGKRAEATTQTRGTCRFCLMHCGVVCTVQGDHLVKVEGDLESKTRGFVCEHGYALRELVHSNARLRAPLVRRGDAFHEVSWDDALGEVARRLEAVKAKHGPEAFAIQTGWPLVRHPLVDMLHRFARAFGSPNVATVSSLCEASLRMGQALTVGSKYAPDVKNVRTLVVWGANPPTTAPPFAHVVAAKAVRGKLVVVDPVRTSLAKEATEYVRVRPGTDGALALGFMHVLFTERLVDEAALAKDTVGLEALKGLSAEYPPDAVERLTSVPKEQVVRVARLLGHEKPVGIWQGLGVEHHESGVQTVRALSALETLCGRFHSGLDLASVLTPPGPRFREELLPALYRMKTPEPVPPPVKARALGSERFPLFEMYNREAQGQVLADAILDGKPYPVRALMLVASNLLVTSSAAQRVSQAVEKLDLLVTVDPFFSASAQRSDVVLPAATFAEAPDVDDRDAVAKGSLVPPQHQASSDWKVLVGLARKLGLGSYFPWDEFADARAARHVPWMRDEGSQPVPQPLDETPKFSTPSGRVELASSLLEAHGHPALPVWTPPSETPREEFPLRLVTGPRPRAYINSQFRGVPSIEARMRQIEALVHPEAAKRFGVANGKPVHVVSPYGSIVARAIVTEDVHPEAVVLPAGWAEANVNQLIAPDTKDPISGFPAFRSGVCRLEP